MSRGKQMQTEEKWILKVLDIGADLYSQACTKCEEAYGDLNEVDCTHCEAKLLHRKLKSMLSRRLAKEKSKQ
jgi:uncharacterized paraquat-inducible protein A